jgi:hypothetical protein
VLPDAANNRYLVIDGGLDALVAVDSLSGDRTMLSNDATGSGPGFTNPLGMAIDSANSPSWLMINPSVPCSSWS